MIEFINKIVANMPSGAVLSGIGIVVEAVLRMIPSKKPLSVLYFAEDVIKAMGTLSGAVGNALDQILPQRIVAQAAPAPAAPEAAPKA